MNEGTANDRAANEGTANDGTANDGTAPLRASRMSARLADGREIIYYDETPHPDRVLHDPRDLPEVHHHSEIRHDTLADEWVTIAGHRQTRTYRPPEGACPLCPSTPDHPTEIPSPTYDVAVFENRFPSFAGTGPATTEPIPFQPQPGNGRCEVVCFTSDHHATMSQLPPTRIATVLQAWTDRTTELARHPGVQQVFCFENRGTEIGVTLDHPHGQIYGYPFITPTTATMLRQAHQHHEAHGTNLFTDILTREQHGPRLITANDHWTAFVPYAARWPLEVHLYPNRHTTDLPHLDDEQREAFIPIYLDVLHRMEHVFDDTLPAITAWHQAPHTPDRDQFRLHLRLFSIRRAPGKIKYLAGSESAMGAFINDITPETAAAHLRDAG